MLFFSLFFSGSASILEIVSVAKKSISLVISFPDVVIAMDTTPSQGAFYFQGSALPLSFAEPGHTLCISLI